MDASANLPAGAAPRLPAASIDEERVAQEIIAKEAVPTAPGRAVEDRAPSRSLFLVADDEPTTQGDYAKWLTDRMGIPMPPSRDLYQPGGQRVAHRNRRIRNTRLKTTLGIELLYPTFREGEAAIEAEEAAAGG